MIRTEEGVFSVVFEVLPHKDTYDAYFEKAKSLRADLESTDGFIDNVRYKSLTRERWILSLSTWRDEKSLVRWRTHERHHEAQQAGRDLILADYNLRVGQIVTDTHLPADQVLPEQRLDETEHGTGTSISVITATRPSEWKETANPYDCAEWLGLNPYAASTVSWDIFDAVATSGDLLLLITWTDEEAARGYENSMPLRDDARMRKIRVIREYGKYDRHEAPQYFRDARQAAAAATNVSISDSARLEGSSPQATAEGDIASGQMRVRAGAAEFPVGRGEGGRAPGATPYDLLSASLAACTAMTIRAYARRNKYDLSHVDVSVSYHHGPTGSRDAFERVVKLEGNLSARERDRLVRSADYCPVSRTLEVNADIRTRENAEPPEPGVGAPASYEHDLAELSIPNIDPD